MSSLKSPTGVGILVTMIGIIDYGMGNLRSVEKAFEHVGAAVVILSDPKGASGVERLVLPGVGAFADGMAHLIERGWVDPIRGFIDSGKPFLGICLGMQLLFDGSQEDATDAGPTPGLKILPGQVVRFPRDFLRDSPRGVSRNDSQVLGSPAPSVDAERPRRLKVPHMGWNTIRWARPDPLFKGLTPEAVGVGGECAKPASPQSSQTDASEGVFMGASGEGVGVYFVHSYYVAPSADDGSRGDAIHSATADYGGPFCASVWRGNVWATQFHPEKSQKIGLAMLKNFAAISTKQVAACS